MQTPDSGAALLPPDLRAFFEGCLQPEPFRIAGGWAEPVPDGGFVLHFVADHRLSIPLHLVLRNLLAFGGEYHLTSLYTDYQPDRLSLEIHLLITPMHPAPCQPSSTSSDAAAESGGGFAPSSLPPSTGSGATAVATSGRPSGATSGAFAGTSGKMTVRQLNALYRALEENRLGPWLGDERFDALTFDDAGMSGTREALLHTGLVANRWVLMQYVGLVRNGIRELGIAA